MGYIVAKTLDEVNPKEIAKHGVKEALSKNWRQRAYLLENIKL